jgi:hypothetical protein
VRSRHRADDQREYEVYRRASSLPTSRVQSIKSCAAGLVILPFDVMIPTGLGKAGSLTGRTVTQGALVPNRSMDAGRIARYSPFASSVLCICTEALTTAPRGLSNPQARNV